MDAAARQLTSGAEPLHPYVCSHVPASLVAKRLDWPRTSVYRLWPSQAAMWDDLIVHTLVTDAASVLEPVPPIELGAALAGSVERTRSSAAEALRTALLAYRRPPRVDFVIAWRVSTRIDAFTRLVERELRARGRRPAGSMTTADLGVALFCVADGLALGGRLSDAIRDAGRSLGPGGLVGFAADALLDRCTVAGAPPAKRARGQHLVAVQSHAWNERQLTALDAAGAIFEEALIDPDSEAVENPLGHLSLARLARATQVTRQAVHGLWSNQQAFSLDLMAYLHRQDNMVMLACARRGLHRVHPRPSRRGVLIDADGVLAEMAQAAKLTALAHLSFVPYYANRRVHEIGEREHDGAIRAFAADLAAAGHSGDLRDGITFTDLATLIMLTLTSTVRLMQVQPSALRTTVAVEGERRSAMAICIDAIAAHGLQLPARGL